MLRRPCSVVLCTSSCQVTIVVQDEQLAEVVRRRDVRHALVAPDDPATAKDLDDPTIEPVFKDEDTQIRSARLRSQ